MSLYPDVAKELVDLRDSYLRSAEILTADKLAECYATFRRRFGPDVLARLDGVALLETLLLDAGGAAAVRERAAYARWLAFGEA